MAWLVTGGAGYIGSHTVRELIRHDREIVVLDDLSTGVAGRVPDDVPSIRADVTDGGALARVLDEHRITGVLHFAAKKSVAESVARPLHYWRQNVGGLEALVAAMTRTGVRRIVFSSSAAVYGPSPCGEVAEETAPAPASPYGETKLAGEWLLKAAGTAHGMSWIALRYFNAVGAAEPVLGDLSSSNLVPRVFDAIEQGRPVTVHGADYETVDGTAVRDYVHVSDLARAHVAAVKRLDGGPAAEVYNVGTGRGSSVLDVVDTVRSIAGGEVAVRMGPRRAGDPPVVVAAVDKIERELGWTATHDLADAVRSAWRARAARQDAALSTRE